MKEKFYVLIFSYGSPELDGPYETREERDAVARKIFYGPDWSADRGDNIGSLDVDADGNPWVGTYTDEDLEEPQGEDSP